MFQQPVHLMMISVDDTPAPHMHEVPAMPPCMASVAVRSLPTCCMTRSRRRSASSAVSVSRMSPEPRLLVITTIVFLKLTVRPCAQGGGMVCNVRTRCRGSNEVQTLCLT